MNPLWEGLNPPYRTIVADPPWPYDGRSAPWRWSSRPSYSLMSLGDLRRLPIADLASKDAHLYLWAVLPCMAEAYDLVAAWGFKPDTLLTWCKPGPGLGAGFRGNTEHIIVARRGWSSVNPTCKTCGGRARGAKKCHCISPWWHVKGEPMADTDAQRRSFSTVGDGSWFISPRTLHSEKPPLFGDLIERMSPGPYVELFARRQRLGWDSWGKGYEVAS